MTARNLVLSVIVLEVLLLSIVAYPFSLMVNAQTDTLSNLELNNSALNDPLSDAVLTLSDGTNILDTEPTPDAANTGSGSSSTDSSSTDSSSTDSSSTDSSSTDSSSTDSSSSKTTPLELNGDAETGEVGSGTGEVGSGTGEVGSGTGEVVPSDDGSTVEVVPSDGIITGEAPEASTDEAESSGNISSTDKGTTTTGDSVDATEAPKSSPIPSESDDSSRGAEIGVTDLSSSASSADTNTAGGNAESVTAASAENPNAVVLPISAGDGQTVSIGDASNSGGSSAKLKLDKTEYKPGDTAFLNILDPAANLDPNSVNTVAVVIDGTLMTATEDGPNSGNFILSFTVPTDNKQIKAEYDSSRPQAKIDINGVTQAGSVEIKEIHVWDFQTLLGEGPPDEVVGNAIEVTLSDGAQLDKSDGFCEAVGLSDSTQCGGSTAVTISYANAPPDLNGQFASALRIWAYVPGVGWADLEEWTGIPPVVDENAKTVTATSPFGGAIYIAGFRTGGQGGGGGAPGLSGAGLVLDLIAPIVQASSEAPTSPQPISEPTTSLPETPALNVEDDDSTSSGDDDSNSNVSATVESVKSGVGVGEQADISPISRNRNITIAVPGEGNVTLSFTNLISEDDALTITTLEDSDLPRLSIAKDASQRGIVKTLDNTPFSLVGSVLVIGPEDVQFNGTITVSIPFKPSLVSQGSDVRLLHYTGSGWEDVTTQADLNNLVSGSLGSLGAVAPAIKSQSISLVSAPQ